MTDEFLSEEMRQFAKVFLKNEFADFCRLFIPGEPMSEVSFRPL